MLAASIAALSVPAFAGEITISLAGKTKAEVVAEIRHAARSVCSEQDFNDLGEQRYCVAEAESDALADLASVEKATGKLS
jgi:hypothetical protein